VPLNSIGCAKHVGGNHRVLSSRLDQVPPGAGDSKFSF
jgi:hypothetical protein